MLYIEFYNILLTFFGLVLEQPNFALEINNIYMKSITKEFLLALILLAYLTVSVLYYSSKLEWSALNITVAILAFITVILYTWFLRKRVAEIKEGIIDEDEMTRKIEVYTGHYSFAGSLFLYVLIFLFANLNHLAIDAKCDGILAFGIYGSLLIYISVYIYLKRSGHIND